MPIETFEVDRRIMPRRQDGPSALAQPGRATRAFLDMAPAILWLTLATGEVMGTTPGHEVWTHQDGWTRAGRLESGDTCMGRDGKPVTVVDLYIDRTPTAVLNFEVDGTFTYFAGGVWVHNTSRCWLATQAASKLPARLDDVFADPRSLRGLTPDDIPDVVQDARSAGWTIGKLGRGGHEGQGFKMAEVVGGKLTGKQIRWHPGGGHHGSGPYWTVSSSSGGKVQVFD